MASDQFIYIAGPCVLETEELALEIGRALKDAIADRSIHFFFKASYDKANRTSLESFRGPGLTDGLRMLATVKAELSVPVLSDVHDVHDVEKAAEVLDVIQIPAFLCRQTDLVVEVARTGKTVNVKKGQFMAPDDMRYVVDKITSTGNHKIILTERGTTFGYHNLVVDFRSISVMQTLGFPVVFDATHSVQTPSRGGESSGDREYVRPLARAAVAYGADGLFTEVYPDPDRAKCDGPNSIHLADVPQLLNETMAIQAAVK